jgi:hydrogenase maturation protease
MNDLASSDTIVVGVGNTILSDDGVGVHAARLLQRDPRVSAGVTILDGGTLGLELIPYLSGASRLLLLDAVDTGEKPGTAFCLAGDQLRNLPGGTNVHQLGVSDLLATLPLVSDTLREVILLGIQPASTDWGTELTPAVQAALGQLVEAAVEQLLRWGQQAVGQPTPRDEARPGDKVLECEGVGFGGQNVSGDSGKNP